MSIVLESESKSSFVDGILSSGVGFTVLLLMFIKEGGSFEFLLYTGDSYLTLFLGLLAIKIPLLIIKEAFFELSNSVVIDEDFTKPIKEVVYRHVPTNAELRHCRIRKIGSSINVSVILYYFNDDVCWFEYRQAKNSLEKELQKDYDNISINYIFE